MSGVMDGNFSFAGTDTIVHSAPDWSIRAISAVRQALDEALNLAADPNAALNEVRNAFDKAATLTRLNSKDAPPTLRNQIVEILSLKPVFKLKGFKRKVLVAGIIVHFLLGNYSTYKGNAIELVNDLRPAAEWALEHVDSLSDDAERLLQQIMEDLEGS